ncbi:ribonuclease HII [bacterium]|nr:ribonuclease HII [bacterium]
MNSLFDFDKNYGNVVGTDEAGRGPAAGGVFAAAVYFPEVTNSLVADLDRLNDSKKLSEVAREKLYDVIIKNSINSVICVDVDEIEKINILNASLKAMKLACENVVQTSKLENFITLVDGNKLIKNYTYSQKYIIKGDGQSAAIAAASILAKVTRDRYMDELAAKYPQYGWNRNSGYLTPEHIKAIDEYGLSEYHRPSFLRKHFEKQKQLTLF